MTRLKSGEFRKMTPEQQIEHRRMLHQRWAIKNRETLRKKYKKYYELWKATKPREGICVKCGAKFNATREYYKLCDKCKEKIHVVAQKRRQILEDKRSNHRAKIQQILDMARKNITQQKIADRFGYTQCGISAIMRKYGIHREKEIFDRAQKKRNNKKKRG